MLFRKIRIFHRKKLEQTITAFMVLSLFFSLFLWHSEANASTTITMGETNVLGYDDSGNGNLLVAQREYLSQAATLSSISFYVRTTGGGLQLGIYQDVGGQPGNLITSTAVFTPVVGWNTISLSPVNLAQGYYWLAYLPQSNSLGFQADLSSGTAKWYSSSFGSMPSTFSSSASSGNDHWSFYATLTVSSGSTPTFTPTTTQPPASTPTATPTSIPSNGFVYPLKASGNGRYLMDQNGKPFFVVGDSPHALIGSVSLTDAATYLASRRSAGVNAMWVEMFCSTYSNICPGYTTYDGIAPFAWTNNDPNTFDLSQPNSAYFSRVDAMVNLAAQYGITLFLDPTETGGWMKIYENNGATKAYNFGVYLGNRYKNSPNIVWQHGNDFQTWTNTTDDNLIQSVANGIRSVDHNHLQTVELDFPTSASLNDSTWAQYIGIDSAYTYYSPYDQVLREYNRSNHIPVTFLEGVYEYQGYSGGYSGPHELRAQEYWSVLSGATGAFYGNANLYSFPSGWKNSNWQTSPGITQLPHFMNLFSGRSWFNLVPDQNHAVVTAGYGTYQSISAQVMGNTSDYVTTAITGDGSLMISYLPTVRTITVNMSKFSGAVNAKWYDPTNGSYTTVSGSPFANSGSRQFTPPGNNAGGEGDWVLVLEK